MSDFQIHYLSECPQCGGNVDDPFMDDLCWQCDHRQHSVAPWDALDCALCWPDNDDDGEIRTYYDDPDEDDEPVRPIVDAVTGGLL